MDKKPAKVYAVEEVEESAEVSADHDKISLQAPGGSKGMDQDEQMAIGEQERGPLRHEPQMVQSAGALPLCMPSLSTLLNPCCLVAD